MERFFQRRDHNFLAVVLELASLHAVEAPTLDARQIFRDMVGEVPVEEFQRKEKPASRDVAATDDFLQRVEGVVRRDVHIGQEPTRFAERFAFDLVDLAAQMREVRVRQNSRVHLGRVDPVRLRAASQERLRTAARGSADVDATRADADRKARPTEAFFELQKRSRRRVGREFEREQAAGIARVNVRNAVKTDSPFGFVDDGDVEANFARFPRRVEAVGVRAERGAEPLRRAVVNSAVQVVSEGRQSGFEAARPDGETVAFVDVNSGERRRRSVRSAAEEPPILRVFAKFKRREFPNLRDRRRDVERTVRRGAVFREDVSERVNAGTSENGAERRHVEREPPFERLRFRELEGQETGARVRKAVIRAPLFHFLLQRRFGAALAS